MRTGRGVCLVLLPWIMAGAVSSVARGEATAAPDPAASLLTNRTSLRANETLTVSVTVTNPGSARSVDAYLGVQFPDGRTRLYLSPEGLAQAARPLARAYGLASGASLGPVRVLSAVLASSVAPGTYTWTFTLTDPDNPSAVVASASTVTTVTGGASGGGSGVGVGPGSGSGSDPLAQVPPCPAIETPLFNTMPMAPGDFLAVRPLGWTSPPIHVFPARHSSFSQALPGETPVKKPFRSPGTLWITELNSSEFAGRSQIAAGLTFYACREFKGYLGHLTEYSPRLSAELSVAAGANCTSYVTGGTPVNACRRQVVLKVDPGELIGYSGDAAGVDFVAVDYRIPPLGFANPAHYMTEMLHYVSPVPYFTPEVRAQLGAKLGSYDGTVPRTAEPRVGLYMQDLPGTAQGNWFIPGVNLAIPFQQPDPFMALVHDYVSGTEPIISMGTSVRGMAVGVYGFTPRASGQVNRDFKDVMADGTIYCYDSFRGDQTAGKINLGRVEGIVLLAMPTPSTLRIEKQGRAGDTCDRLAPWAFTVNATLFER